MLTSRTPYNRLKSMIERTLSESNADVVDLNVAQLQLDRRMGPSDSYCTVRPLTRISPKMLVSLYIFLVKFSIFVVREIP